MTSVQAAAGARWRARRARAADAMGWATRMDPRDAMTAHDAAIRALAELSRLRHSGAIRGCIADGTRNPMSDSRSLGMTWSQIPGSAHSEAAGSPGMTTWVVRAAAEPSPARSLEPMKGHYFCDRSRRLKWSGTLSRRERG